MSAPEEIRAAARAAIAVGMPYTATASFDTAGPHHDGPDAREFRGALRRASMPRRWPSAPIAASAPPICSSPCSAMTEARPDAVVIAKANAGVPQWHGAHIHYSGSPELMAIYAALAIDAGARIIGGCCGTRPAHLARHAARARRPCRRGRAPTWPRSSPRSARSPRRLPPRRAPRQRAAQPGGRVSVRGLAASFRGRPPRRPAYGWIASSSRGGRGARAHPFAHAAEGPDRGGRSPHRRDPRARSGAQSRGRRSRSTSSRRRRKTRRSTARTFR